MDDSSDSKEKNTRKNVSNILKGLGFEDTAESRKLDPWMTSVLSNEQQKEIDQQQQQRQCTLPVEKKGKGKLETRPRKNSLLHECSKKSTTQSIRLEREMHAELRSKILGEMGGSDLKFVCEKSLTTSDTARGQNRLLIPASKVENEYLNQEEKMKLEKEEEELMKQKGSIMVKILISDKDCDCHEGYKIKVHDIKLTKWSSNLYVMNGIWHSLVKEYKLEEDMVVELWAFRVDSRLCFALIYQNIVSKRSRTDPKFQ